MTNNQHNLGANRVAANNQRGSEFKKSAQRMLR